MKTDIMITCGDKHFSRMLEIVFTYKNYTVTLDGNNQSLIIIRDYPDTRGIIEVSPMKAPNETRRFERPFYVRDIVRHIELMMHTYKNPDWDSQEQKIDDLVINYETKQVFYGEDEIIFTHREFDLLVYLYQNRGNPVSRKDAISNVWKFDFEGNTNIVDVYIRYLREKLDDRYQKKFISTVRNKGYMLI